MRKTAIIMAVALLAAGAQARDSKLANLVPAGYTITEEIKGDLNKDGLEDYVFIIKGTKKDDDCRENGQDCSLRGIMVVFSKGGRYELALENRDCFASEDRNGGVYYPPDLSVSVKKGNLYIGFDHGRYGSWSYTFRYQNSDFELIGYDNILGVTGRLDKIVSINFQAKKMLTKIPVADILVDDFADGTARNAKFDETWENFTPTEPIKLRKIADFREFDVMDYIKIKK